ncbi:hypothetical protein KWH77_13895 [Enterobacter sichuanensis]|uniref:hypothetical protein n=1 Tax=Enterobacter sichuanensis TaxID=2071710 RepID=UPI0021D15283|nr:hypothetical protein [Enterobacter sichuanensis]MCU6427293.1 hypothetical protein [Enterobacter sichuanensis]
MQDWFASYEVYGEGDEKIAQGTVIRTYDKSVGAEKALESIHEEICREYDFKSDDVHYVAFNRV